MQTALLLAAIAFGVLPHAGIAVKDRVDLIEHNLCDQEDQSEIEQIILYEWSAEKSRYIVRHWFVVKSEHHLPFKDWRTGDYRIVCLTEGVFRDISAPSLLQTWTNYDPELLNRMIVPKEERRGLSSPGK